MADASRWSEIVTGGPKGLLARLGERIVDQFAQCSIRLPLRYGATFLLLLVAIVLRGALDDVLSGYPFLLFIPVIFAAAILFDRGSGLIATVLSAVATAYFFVPPYWSFDLKANDWVALFIYILVGLMICSIIEALRSLTKRLKVSDERRRLLLEELNHRTKNDMAMIVSVLRLHASRSPTRSVAEALEKAAHRIFVFADAQKLLRYDEHRGAVDIDHYFLAVCRAQEEFLSDARAVDISLSCEKKTVSFPSAVSLGLILNELITNAAKYAFPDGRSGKVSVSFACTDKTAELLVEDNGVGKPDGAPQGLGSELIELLSAQIRGDVRHESGPGTRVRITFPLEALRP